MDVLRIFGINARQVRVVGGFGVVCFGSSKIEAVSLIGTRPFVSHRMPPVCAHMTQYHQTSPRHSQVPSSFLYLEVWYAEQDLCVSSASEGKPPLSLEPVQLIDLSCLVNVIERGVERPILLRLRG